MTALSGIDQALWDLKGKHLGVPVFELLGGEVRDRIRLYQHTSIGDIGDSSKRDALAQDAQEQVEAGFTAIKLTPTGVLERIESPWTIEQAKARVETVREAIGEDVDIALDFHGKVSKSMARVLASALEPYQSMFYEEPVVEQGHGDELPAIREHSSIPIAIGERRYSRWEFKSLLSSHAVDVIQPDLCYAGGISEVRRIASMAEAYDVALAPHCPLGPIALAASLQIDACCPNALIQEQVIHRPDVFDFDSREYLDNPELFDMDEEGYVSTPTGSGLGIQIDENSVRNRSKEELDIPHFIDRRKDGSVAEH